MSRHASVVTLALALSWGALPSLAEKLPSGTESRVEPGAKHPDSFEGVLAFPVYVNGREVLPMGSRVEGAVRGSKKRILLSPRTLVLPDGRKVDFNAAVRQIDRKQLKAEQGEGAIEQKGSKADAAREATYGGLMGAQVGVLTAGSAKGMGVGAAAGVAAVLIGRKIASRGHGAVIPAGTQLTLSLTRPLEIPDNLAEAKPPEVRPTDPDDRRPILRRQ